MWKGWTKVACSGAKGRGEGLVSVKSTALVALRKFLQKLQLFPCEMTEEVAAPPPAKRPRGGGEAGEHPHTLAGAREGSSDETPTSKQPLAESRADTDVPFVRIRRKKCALLISYNGQGYLGMQLNPGTKTIERDLLEGLAKAEAFPDDMKSDLGKLQFQRCSRTDKGVSAARQVVSIKHISPDKRVIELANKYLPPQIKIMGLRRVTKMFNSKLACSSRTYEYLLPTYAFAPYAWTTLDFRINDETREKVSRLLKMYEKSHNFHNFTSGKRFEEDSAMRYIISFTCGEPFLATCSTAQQQQQQQQQQQHASTEEHIEERDGQETLPNTSVTGTHSCGRSSITVSASTEGRPGEVMEGEEICDEGESNALAQRKCEISIAKQSEEVITKRSKEDSYTREGSEEAIVKGSKDESWTQEGSEQAIVKGSEEDSCEGVMNEKREQSSVGDSRESVSGCEVVAQVKSKTLKKMKEVEFISLQVKGQSFMIHQIRKMVGLVIAIVRGFAPETMVVEAFKKEKVDIPRAPALGLLLENVFFDTYNKKFASDGSHEALDWQECVEEVEEFKRRHIHQSIVDTEIADMSMMQWLGSLQIHDFQSTKKRLLNSAAQQQQKEPEFSCDATASAIDATTKEVDSKDSV